LVCKNEAVVEAGNFLVLKKCCQMVFCFKHRVWMEGSQCGKCLKTSSQLSWISSLIGLKWLNVNHGPIS
jgi:hypothetical protein